ncbi:TetR/AcrR family transcriptional regulator [Balneola sp. MJW-20]|uniref:TetR/AcrR family transcriptional regulator n=1 Tax=Gracilimonas aurantiaca TaxID=3234185 RepID=UPI003465C05D
MAENDTSLRDQILETSRKLLYNQGHQSLSMRKIAGMVGVTATSIYLYFENKDHLLHTLIEESVEDLSRSMDEKLKGVTGTLERFKAIINSYISFARENPEKYEVIYMVRSDAMARYPKEKFRKARRCYEHLVRTIEEGAEEGLMDVDDPVLAAYSIWAQLHGIVSVVLNQRLDSRIDKQKFIQESTDHVVQGFLFRTTVS